MILMSLTLGKFWFVNPRGVKVVKNAPKMAKKKLFAP